jgi:GNAT superfamily N-acetyltransferase
MLRWTKATVTESRLLAEMNSRLLEDEGHRNRGMSLKDLDRRMSGWLSSGEYEAILFRTDLPVAYALFRRDGRDVFLRQFFVERERRRQGVGREALAILRESVWDPSSRVTLEVLAQNVAGKAFWQSVGFRDYAVGMELVPEPDAG